MLAARTCAAVGFFAYNFYERGRARLGRRRNLRSGSTWAYQDRRAALGDQDPDTSSMNGGMPLMGVPLGADHPPGGCPQQPRQVVRNDRPVTMAVLHAAAVDSAAMCWAAQANDAGQTG